MTKLTVLTLVLLTFSPATPSQVKNESPEIDIRESVFRSQIAHCHRSYKPDMYFLSYRKQDPSEALIARLFSRGLRVNHRSKLSSYKDKDTGRWSIWLDVHHIELRSDRRADVSASCLATPLDERTYTYRLVRSKRRWIVTDRKLVGFS